MFARVQVTETERDVVRVSRPRAPCLAHVRTDGAVAAVALDHLVPDQWAREWTHALFNAVSGVARSVTRLQPTATETPGAPR